MLDFGYCVVPVRSKIIVLLRFSVRVRFDTLLKTKSGRANYTQKSSHTNRALNFDINAAHVRSLDFAKQKRSEAKKNTQKKNDTTKIE